MKKISKASISTLALAASLAILVAGCGNNAGGSAGSANNTASTGAPIDGGTLTMAELTKYNDMLIPDMDATVYTEDIVQYAFDPLLTIDKNLNFVGDLVKSWTWSADKKTVTMTLANAKWSDGQPITSDDVLFTLNYLGSKTYNTTLQGQFGYLVGSIEGSDELLNGTKTSFADTGGFKKISDTQFSLTFKKVDAAVLYSDISNIQPIPEHVLKGIPISTWGTASFDKMPTVVSGAYTFTKVNGQDNVQMAANPNYFLGKPHIANLVIKTISPDVAPGLLSNGQVQYILGSGITPVDVIKLKQVPGLVVKTPPKNGFSYVGLKDKLPEFKDVRVRQALMYGLDRQSMVDGILKGLGTVVNGPIPPVSWAAATTQDGMTNYNYDSAKAEQLLDEAGWKKGTNGFRVDPSTGKTADLTLSYPSGSPPTQAEAVAIQQNYAKIGIKVTLNAPMDFNTLVRKVETDDKSIQMWLMGWNLYMDPDPRGIWQSTAAFNFERWVDPQSDSLIADTWNAAAFDQNTRKQALFKWQVYVNKQVPEVFLWASDWTFVYTNKLNIPDKDFSTQGPINIQDWWLSN